MLGNGRPIIAGTVVLLLLLAGAAPGTPAPGDLGETASAPSTGKPTLEECRSLLEHGRPAEAEALARALLADVEAAHGADSLQAAEVLHVLVEALWRGGKVRDPETRRLAERAVAIKEKELGPDHLDVAASLSNLGSLAADIGDYGAARPLHERALAIREKHLGPDHPDVAMSLSRLGNLLADIGDHRAARPLLERSLAIREKNLGPDHPDVSSSLNNLAELLREIGDYEGARQLHERALAARARTLGPQHPTVARSLLNLAIVHFQAGNYKEARVLSERAVAIQEEALDPNHPDRAVSANFLGALLVTMGDLSAAKPLLERALAIWEGNLGPDHARVASVVTSLGHLHLVAGDFLAAKARFERALAIRERVLPPNHADLAWSLNNLAAVLAEMGDYATARPLYERSLRIREDATGPEHPDLAANLMNLAGLLKDMGDHANAKRLLERALAIQEKTLGPRHAHMALSLNNLGNLLTDIGDYAAARQAYERALSIQEGSLGPSHADLALTLDNMSVLLARLGENARARESCERSLRIREETSGPNHPSTGHSLGNLAMLLSTQGEYESARPLYERALETLEGALGRDHPSLAPILGDSALALASSGALEAARSHYEHALETQEAAVGADHPEVALILNNLGRLQLHTGERAAALAAGLRSEGITRNHLRLTIRSLPERQALRYAAVRVSGLDLALTAAGLEPDPQSSRLVWDALIRSRGVVLDEMAARHRAAAATEKSEVARRSHHLASARTKLANLALRGPGGQSVERYQTAIELAHQEKERAEAALADLSEAFRDELARAQVGITQVADALPGGSALIAHALHDRPAPPSVEPTRAGEVAFFQVNHPEAPPPESPRAPIPSRGDPGPSMHGTRGRDAFSPSTGVRGSEEVVSSFVTFVLRSGDTQPRVVPLGPAASIDALIRKWRAQAALAPRGSRPSRRRAEADYRGAGEALRRAVWDPVAEHLGDARRVFIVPDGTLHLVNFAALPTGEDRYLVETGPLVHYLSAERDLVRPEASHPPGEGLFILGGPDFDAPAGPPPAAASTGRRSKIPSIGPGGASVPPAPEAPEAAPATSSTVPPADRSAGSAAAYRGPRFSCADFASMKFPPLPASRKEADEIASLWKKRSRTGGDTGAGGSVLELTGAQAAEGALKRLAHGHRVVHAATHGFFLDERCPSALGTRPGGEPRAGGEPPPPLIGENPLLLSGLVLAGANRREAPGSSADAEDGILTAEEIASLDLSGVEWAVLSACETGLGKVQAGEGVLGLRRAFQVAGAGTLIMSLWRVDDEAAREWMRRLYEGRLSGLSTAEAIREASLGMLEARRRAGRDTHPASWGAFVAAGDWR